MQMLIGITGKAGAGKDTLADALVRKHGGTKVSFSDPLKTACKVLFDLSSAQLHNRALKEKVDDRWGRSPRQLMQFLGTDLLRNQFDKEIFLKSMHSRIRRLQTTKPLVIVSDCRFENETDLVRELGGKIIHLRRLDLANVSSHVSEDILRVLPGDTIQTNNGTVSDLVTKCEFSLFPVASQSHR